MFLFFTFSYDFHFFLLIFWVFVVCTFFLLFIYMQNIDFLAYRMSNSISELQLRPSASVRIRGSSQGSSGGAGGGAVARNRGAQNMGGQRPRSHINCLWCCCCSGPWYVQFHTFVQFFLSFNIKRTSHQIAPSHTFRQ